MLVSVLLRKLLLLFIASTSTARQWKPKQATRAQIVARSRKNTPHSLQRNFDIDENDDWQEFELIGDRYIRRKREYTNARLERRQGPSGTPTPAAGALHASCSGDGSCNTGLTCDGGQCLYILGQDCAVNTDCQSGLVCGVEGTCENPAQLNEACDRSSQCDQYLECSNGQFCTRTPRSLPNTFNCIVANDCQSDYCDSSQTCAACSNAGQCSTGQVCTSGICSSCTSTLECSNGQICEAGLCSQCNAANDCSSGTTLCTSGQQCMGTSSLDPAGSCGVPGDIDDVCYCKAQCTSSITDCYNFRCSNGALGQSCNDEVQCVPNSALTCTDYRCAQRPGVPCSIGSDCPSGICYQNQCGGVIGSNCGSANNCLSGYCGNGKCTDGSLGSQCGANMASGSFECQSGKCFDNLCVSGDIGSRCGGTDYCASGVCIDYTCQSKDIGARCNQASDCNSGNCFNGQCQSNQPGSGCGSDAGCSTNICFDYVCQTGDAGSGCNSPAMCINGACAGNACSCSGYKCVVNPGD